MNIENLTRIERKTLRIGVRIKPSQNKWIREKNYSPTAIFQEALKDLGYGKEESLSN